MAQLFAFECDHCHWRMEVWEDGNPFYLDEHGKKIYAPHPSPEHWRCIGCVSQYLCLNCGGRARVDNRKPRTACRKCKSSNFVHCMELDEKKCPYCQAGTIRMSPGPIAIS